MAEPLTLTGYRYSVYTRIVRMGLMETGLEATYREVDPFTDPPDPALRRLTPLGRVPVLTHGDFTLTETSAILRYLVRLSGAPLVPRTPRAAARMDQVIGVIDGHGYWPMIRQVFAEAVFAPREGRAPDLARLETGLAAAQPVLSQLDRIADEGLILSNSISLADLHLLPMLDYFTRALQGAALLAHYDALDRYWRHRCTHATLGATSPF